MSVADLWILMPLLLPAIGALLALLLGAISPGRAATQIAVVALLATALWSLQAPPLAVAPQLGIAATPLARLFSVFFSLMGAAVLLVSVSYNDLRGIRGEEYPATVLFGVFGMVALASATNLLVLFLGLEAMTFAFYILVAMDLGRESSAEAGMKYLLPGALSAAFLAFGIALLYTVTGSLELAAALRGGGGSLLALAGWGFLLIGVAFKMSLVPAHLWTPDVYQGAPTPVVALLSGGSKGAAILLLLMLLPLAGDITFLSAPLRLLSLLSMVVGNLAALLQSRVKRMLAYSSIGQMGYVVLALVGGGAGGYRAAAFYAVAYGVMSLAAFAALAALEPPGRGELLQEYRGAGKARPLAAGVLCLALFALAGIPPTAGFTGKFLIFTAAIRGGEIPLAVIGILTAAVSAYYYLRVVVVLFMQDPPETEFPATSATMAGVLAAASTCILFLGLFPSHLLDLLKPIFP
ncbi:MAG TPA: NADH-quinone oxidoreductase subunit N [Geobacteraceae bacterium]|nr:NADH-quinone oxidoreductase subunit N [Geobacteraceae bacterium]